jgi:hypothetical protein
MYVVDLNWPIFAGAQPNPRSGEDHLRVRVHPRVPFHLRDRASRAGAFQVGDRHAQCGGQPGALPRQRCRGSGGMVSIKSVTVYTVLEVQVALNERNYAVR